jgi:hypothetical protein
VFSRIYLSLLLAGFASAQPGPDVVRATMANVVKLNAFADNWCLVYINGKLAAADQIEFLPHNVITVNVLPSYPMTIAVVAKDNADPKTGLEYGNQIGDAGFIPKMADGTVTSSAWKVKTFFKGPLNGDTRNPRVQYTPVPANWFAPDFDDSTWAQATEYTEARVRPGGDYATADFAGAKFIWSDDLDLDNTVIFRYKAQAPPAFRKTWNADGDLDITNLLTEMRMAPLTAPHLFQVNPGGLATGYLTRVRGSQETTEPFAGPSGPVPIDIGPATDLVYLILYGANLPPGAITATIGGVPADLAYAGPLQPANGVAQFNILIPRSLTGAGTVDVVLTAGGKSSNAVTVNIR